MQMRTGRMAGIAAEGNELTCADRHIKRRQTGIGHTGFMLILVAAEGSLDAG